MASTTTAAAQPESAADSASTARRIVPVLVAVLILITVAVYGHCAGFDYVQWDDQLHIYQNPYVENLSTANLHHLWTISYEGLYIPVSYTVYALIAHAARMPRFDTSVTIAPTPINPHPFHVANLILHVLNVLLVFALLRGLLRTQSRNRRGLWGNAAPAFVGALLFALHPLQVESVAWISELRGLLCSVFCLAAVCLYLNAVVDARSKNAAIPAGRWAYWAAFILSILAGLSKPSIAALPIALFAIDRWAAGRPAKSCVAAVLPWVLLSIGLVWRTHDAQPVQSRVLVPLWTHPFVAGDALAFYLAKLLVPWGLTIDYGRKPGLVTGETWGYLTWLVPAAVAAIVYRYRKSISLWVVGGFFSLAMLLPVLGLAAFAFQDFSTVADRYTYLAMVGPALALAAFLARLAGGEASEPKPASSTSARNRKRQGEPRSRAAAPRAIAFNREAIVRAYAATGAVIVAYAVVTVIQVGHWKNSMALFSYAVRMSPNEYQLRSNYGSALLEEGRLDEAMDQFNEGIRIQPGFPVFYTQVGLIQLKRGDYAGAVKSFETCVTYQPNLALGHRDLGEALLREGLSDQAAEQFKTAIDLEPLDATCHLDYANALLQSNRFSDAAAEYRAALAIDSSMPEALYSLAYALLGLGDTSGAEAMARQAVGIVPNVARAHGALARALDAEGRMNEAVDEYRKAIQLDPNDSMMHYNLGVIYFSHKDPADAIPELRQTASLQPTASNYDALAQAYLLAGDKANARLALEQELQIDPNAASAKQQLAGIGQ